MSGGRIGVGTTSPTQKVVIKKSSFGSVDIGATVASGATLLAAGGNTDYGTFFATQNSSDNYTGLIQQRRQSAATFYNLALNPYGGNVGIGTTSPGVTYILLVEQGKRGKSIYQILTTEVELAMLCLFLNLVLMLLFIIEIAVVYLLVQTILVII